MSKNGNEISGRNMRPEFSPDARQGFLSVTIGSVVIMIAVLLLSLFLGSGDRTDGKLFDDGDGYMHALRLFEIQQDRDPNHVTRAGGKDGFVLHWTSAYDKWVMAIESVIPDLSTDGIADSTADSVDKADKDAPAGMTSKSRVLALSISSAIASAIAAGLIVFSMASIAMSLGGRNINANGVILSCLVAAGALGGLGWLGYSGFGRADHHMLTLMAVAGSIALGLQRRWWYALSSGIIGGLSLWISVESLPFLLMGAGIIGSLENNTRRWGRLALWSLSLGITASIASVLDMTSARSLFTDLDRISILHGQIFVVAGVIFLLIDRTASVSTGSGMKLAAWLHARGTDRDAAPDSPAYTIAREIGGSLGNLGVLKTMILAWAILGAATFFMIGIPGASSALSPFLVENWWNGLKELQSGISAAGAGMWPAAAILILWGLLEAIKMDGESKERSLIIIFIAVGALALSLLHIRFSPWAVMFSIMAAGIGVGGLYSRSPREGINTLGLGFIALFGLLVTSWGGFIVAKTAFNKESSKDIGIPYNYVVCLPESAAMLAESALVRDGVESPLVVTNPGFEPAMLWSTKSIRTLGANFQKNTYGLESSIRILGHDAFSADQAPERIREGGVDGILLCMGAQPGRPDGLQKALEDGNIPKWLVEVDSEEIQKTGFKLWKVIHSQ